MVKREPVLVKYTKCIQGKKKIGLKIPSSTLYNLFRPTMCLSKNV